MPGSSPIICKPTRWFLIRALAMLGMFGVFTVWFYYDAAIGYRGKNQAFFTERAFHKAVADFTRLNAGGRLTPEAWREHAASQNVDLPNEPGILPASLDLPLPWPEILHDLEKVRPLNAGLLWREYTKSQGMNIDLPEEYYTPRKIKEQWVVFWICLALTVVALFFLLRTLRRSIRLDPSGIQGATGHRLAFEDLTLLDLRKWDTKGIAFLEYQTASGSGRMRLDGLTYGGFRHEDGQPAERMMEMLRANFSGEILEYTSVGGASGIHGGELSDGRSAHITTGERTKDAPGEEAG
ncbi:MAG: hypothetical protein ACNA8L_01650 [Luteolibacter sp.]